MKKLLILVTAAACSAAGSRAADSKVDFAKDIQPILSQTCVKCHGPEKQKGKMRLDTKEAAFKGGKTERMILVRDHNKLVCSAVMRNPRMSELEVESIANMRNIAEEVLRLIAMKRDWVSKYNIAVTLARNPKCPVGVVLPLINRLTLRDLKGLKDDKGVSETVRSLARKVYLQRSHKA